MDTEDTVSKTVLMCGVEEERRDDRTELADLCMRAWHLEVTVGRHRQRSVEGWLWRCSRRL